ncbi:MAG: PilC/PilY family type IV pilus protein, partial [Gammaproteobacteria bacterium]
GASTYTKVFDGNPDQPITNTPALAEHPTEEGYMVYFGTGSIFSNDDALNDGEDPSNPGSFTKKQAVYGIWVDTSSLAALKANADGNGFPYTSSDLQSQTLAATSKQFIVDGPIQTVRITPTEQAVNYRCPTPSDTCTLHKGWKVPLPNCGERMIGTPFVRAGRIQFVTSNPTGLNCGERTLEGDSWVMSLDYVNGGDGENTVVYNLNDDLILDDGDTVPYNVGGDTVNKAPVGLGLGEGNISQPTFVRLRLGTDKMFINGLILAFPPISNPGEILGGHIDVETDSPTNGVIATNNRNKHSEGYNIQINDGLGGAVDGHVHDYDGIHNVDYVDLFELEPRRGQANLNAVLAAPPVGGVCSTTDNEKGILVGTSCIQAIEGELNRAYDTLHTNADGKSDPITGGISTYQSEVNSLNAIAPPDYTTAVPAQKFIVVLANADLSTGGVLQIGCRTWPVVAYQTMITSQLGKDPDQMDDTVNGGTDNLVFTLNSIVSDGSGGVCTNIDDNYAYDHGLSKSPTLRIGFGERAIYDEGIIPTRSQCVLGLHKPDDKVCFTDQQILTAAEANLAAGADPSYDPGNSCNSFKNMSTPPANYVRNPAWNLHITPDGGGYRWRNGALTLQLLKVKSDGTADYTLQPASDLTSGSGTIAKAFTVGNKGAITADNTTKGPNESGMLYEADIFFHYAALVDGIRNSDPANNSTPPEGGCYGGSGYNGKTTIDVGGLNPADYKKLVNPLNAQCDADPASCPLQRYSELLQIIEAPESDAQLNQALLDLANLLATSPELAEYVKYREYVSPKFNYGKDLLDIDRKQLEGGGSGTSTNEDGTPLDVTTIETIDLEAKGPNFSYGRRNWVDIRQ